MFSDSLIQEYGQLVTSKITCANLFRTNFGESEKHHQFTRKEDLHFY